MVIRRQTPGDAAAVRALLAGLGDEGVRTRFSGGFVDFADEAERAAYVAVDGEDVVGHAAIRRLGPASAEFAVAVDAGRRRSGIGSHLMRGLTEQARTDGIEILVADVLPENAAMLALLANLGLPVRVRDAGDRLRIEVGL